MFITHFSNFFSCYLTIHLNVLKNKLGTLTKLIFINLSQKFINTF